MHLKNLTATLFTPSVAYLEMAETNSDKDRRLDEELENKIDAFIDSGDLADEDRGLALSHSLSCKWSRLKPNQSASQYKARIDVLMQDHYAALEKFPDNRYISYAVELIIKYFSTEETKTRYGLTDTERLAYFSPFLSAKNKDVRDIAETFYNRQPLTRGAPISLQMPTLDGEPFDTSDLKGKIVLIDHWDTDCAPCIAAMPSLHETYLKYKDKGFEVISIAYDGTSGRQQVERLKKRMELTWTTLNGEGLWTGVSVKYGISGFPSYMLLDRKGRWLAGNDTLRNTNNLPVILDSLLAEEKDGYYERQPAMANG